MCKAREFKLFIFWDSTCSRVVLLKLEERGSSSIGRVSAFQAEGCEFEARLPLHLTLNFYKTTYKIKKLI